MEWSEICGLLLVNVIGSNAKMEQLQRYPSNRLLAALPPADLRRLERFLHPVALRAGDVLNEPGHRLRYAIFPETCVISLLALMREGRGIEVGTVGCEGMNGFAPLLGVDHGAYRMIVQVPGSARRIKIADLAAAARPDSPLWQLVLRYSVAFARQLGQGVACAKFHSVDQRCCRWLLATHDRVAADRIELTHEFLALMLGTRRASVSQALKKLRDRGAIQYRRSRITILDRAALAADSCECYQAVVEMYRGIFGQ